MRTSSVGKITSTPYYDVVLQAYAVCNGGKAAAVQTEGILLHMLDKCRNYLVKETTKKKKDRVTKPPEPTLKTFNIVLNCWA